MELFEIEKYKKIYPRGIGNHYWSLARNQIILKLLKSCDQYKSDDLVLDVGCGPGVVTSFLDNKKINIKGVEAARIPYRFCTSVIDEQDVFGLPQDIQDEVKVVLLLDVLEHIEKPDFFLSRIESTFKNLEHIIITLPARQEIWSNYDEYNGHYQRYSLEAVSKTVNKMNFLVTKKGYFFNLLYLVAFLLSLVKKDRNLGISAPKTKPEKFVHYIVAKIFYLENIIMPDFFYGSSLYTVMKRKA